MNIKTFGPVDDRSLKQLETCMKAGDAEFGVLFLFRVVQQARQFGFCVSQCGWVPGYHVLHLVWIAFQIVEFIHAFQINIMNVFEAVSSDRLIAHL